MGLVSLLTSPAVLLISRAAGLSPPCVLLPPRRVWRPWLPMGLEENSAEVLSEHGSHSGTTVQLCLSSSDLGQRRRRAGATASPLAEKVGQQRQDSFPGQGGPRLCGQPSHRLGEA